jgi:hypothetical protein
MRVRALLVPLLLAATPLASQQAPMLESGARVRVTVDSAPPRVQIGVYQMVNDTALVLQSDSAQISIPLGLLSRVEVSRGRHSHWLAGAGVGFLVGAGAVLAVQAGGNGSTDPCNQEQNQDASLSSGQCLAIAVAGVALVTGLGALIGGSIRTERWQDVPLDQLRVSFVPHGRGLVVGISAAF